jgi:phage regulator Rha-like protein
MTTLVHIEAIEKRILLLRGQKVMLDADLALIYRTTTKRLNEQVKRNKNRFPDSDFMFQLNLQERKELVANCDRFKNLKHSITLPYAFTEHGAIMLANVLNSKTAVEANIQIVKTFIKMRTLLVQHKELAQKLSKIESHLSKHDKDIHFLIRAIRQLMTPTSRKQRKIGF